MRISFFVLIWGLLFSGKSFAVECEETRFQIDYIVNFEFGIAEAKIRCETGNEKYCDVQTQQQMGNEWVFNMIKEYESASSSHECKAIRKLCIERCLESEVLEDDLLCYEGCLQYRD